MKLTATTKTLPATDTLGTRVRATCAGKQVTRAYDHSLSPLKNHVAAAGDALRKVLGRGLSLDESQQAVLSATRTETGARYTVDIPT